MVTLFLLWSVIQISKQSDIALLLGTDSVSQFQIDLYTAHLNTTIQICPNQISFDGYPGNFDNDFNGRIGSIYIDNIGIFVCGGYTVSGHPEGGCNWLRVNQPVEGNSINHSWQKIGYRVREIGQACQCCFLQPVRLVGQEDKSAQQR